MTRTSNSGAWWPGRLLGVSLLALVLAVAGCGEREPTGGDRALTPAEFIEVIVALREAEWEVEKDVAPADAEVEFDRRKAEILARHGVTAEGVRAFIDRHHGRPGLMASVWDSIANRLRIDPSDHPAGELFQFEESW
jgi:hypothetical protein